MCRGIHGRHSVRDRRAFAPKPVNPPGGPADRNLVPIDLADSAAVPTTSSVASPPDLPSRWAVASLLTDAGEAKLLFDTSGTVARAAGATRHLLGVDLDTIIGSSAGSLPPGFGPAVAGAAHQALSLRTGTAADMQIARVDGTSVVAHVKATPLIEDDQILGVAVAVTDAAASRVLEMAAAGNLPAALDAARFTPFATFFLDAKGNCIAVGASWERVMGLGPEHTTGQGWLRVVSAADADSVRLAAVAAHRNNDGWRVQFRHASGQFTVDCAAEPVISPAGETVGYVGFAVDRSQVEAVSAPTSAPTPQSTPPPAPASTGAPIVSAAPVSPVQKHQLRKAEGADSWQPPKLAEGFTDPSRLSTERPPEAVAERHEPAPTEPGTDRVTGLPNRLLFAQHVAATIERIKTDALTVAVSFVDLQGIRAQRTTLGRRAANDSLFLLAKRLESTIRSIEIAGAIDEDVFAILSINWLFAEDLPIVARRLLGRLEEPLAGRDGEFVVDMRLGMSVARPGDDVEALFARTSATLLAAQDLPDRYLIELV